MSTHDNVVKPVVEAFLDTDSETFSYVVYDHVGGHAAIIDPVLDYDPKSGRTRTDSAQQLIDYVRENKLTVDWILETHAHADHLSAAQFVRDSVGGKTAIGEKIVDVQKIFRDVFNLEKYRRSIQRLLTLPDETRLFMCHDYPGEKREHQYETTVAAQKKHNIHVHEGVTEEEFVAMREARDSTLEMPRLILPSIQLNIRAGEMPPAEDNGTVYFKIPVNKL